MNMADEQYGPLQELWCSQETSPVEADPSGLRLEAEQLGATLSRRNRRETVIAAPLAIIFVLIAIAEAVNGSPVSAGGALVVSASMLWVRYALRRWGRSGMTPEDLERDGRSFLALYRDELVRQRRLVLHAWLWYVLPIFGGLLLCSLGTALQRREPVETWLGSFSFIVMVAIALTTVLLNLMAARGLNQRIAALHPAQEG